jgi:ABC-type sugar transport system permease subunit
MWFFQPDVGLFNALLAMIGIQGPRWLFSETWALPSIMLMSVWSIGPSMIIFLAGLQGAPADLYEAAQIDGASKWQTFTKITLPLVKTPLMVAVLFRTLDVLRIYDLPAILTNGGGGTTSLSMLVIKQIGSGFHSASALSTIVFLLIAFVAFLFIKFGGADVIQRPPRRATPKDTNGPKDQDKDAEPAAGNPVAANATTPGA